MTWVCGRPFTTVNFGAAQLSCAQLMNQFVPGNLVVAGWLGLGFVKCTCQWMMTENGGLVVRPRATVLTSVGSWSVTMGQAAIGL